MFNKIGTQIKNVTRIIFWISAIGFIILGFMLIITGLPGVGLPILIGGPIASWVGLLAIYGLGHLIENSDKQTELLKTLCRNNAAQGELSLLSDAIVLKSEGSEEHGSQSVKEEVVTDNVQEQLAASLPLSTPYFTFGSYVQDKSNQPKPIEWKILSKANGKVLLVSRYALDCKPFNSTCSDVTWESCSLRKWLNSEFYENAFSAEEKTHILTASITADMNPEYHTTEQGGDTEDKVFLLSIAEAKKLFEDDDARLCAPTSYTVANNAYQNKRKTIDGEGACVWWLRTSGNFSNCATVVNYNGHVQCDGRLVDGEFNCVRPAICVEIIRSH